MSREVSTELDCRRIHVIVHQSANDKLAVAHSSSLFEAESYSDQRERKSVWQGFQYKSKICELGLANLQVFIYTQLTHRRPKLTIRGIDQIFMIYLRVSSET